MPLLSPDGRTGYVADFAADELTVWDVDFRRQRLIELIDVGLPAESAR